MTRDDIIRMAREAGISDTNLDFQMVSPDEDRVLRHKQGEVQ